MDPFTALFVAIFLNLSAYVLIAPKLKANNTTDKNNDSETIS